MAPPGSDQPSTAAGADPAGADPAGAAAAAGAAAHPQPGKLVPRGGFALRAWASGEAGRDVLCIHETGAGAEAWRPLAGALPERLRLIAYDRRGWGGSGEPDGYLRTTIGEQASDAEAVIGELGRPPVVLCGSGLGAVVALELAVRRPALVQGALLVEPPLLAFLPEATERISGDAEALRDAARRDSVRTAAELYLSGALGALGAGAARIPRAIATTAADRPATLLAELAAVPSWTIPVAELASLRCPTIVAVADSTPPLLERASRALAERLPGGRLHAVAAAGLPQVDCPAELAELVAELA